MNACNKLSDKELIVLLQRRDKDAYTEVYNRYKGVLYVHALRLIKDPDEAEDIIHELFTVLWEKASELNLNKTLPGYLYGAIKNRIFDILAHKKMIESYTDRLQKIIDDRAYMPDELFREKELKCLIEKEVTLLPKKMRDVFELSRKKHLSHYEIAEKLNISDKTVKKQISNALKILRAKINTIAFLFIFF